MTPGKILSVLSLALQIACSEQGVSVRGQKLPADSDQLSVDLCHKKPAFPGCAEIIRAAEARPLVFDTVKPRNSSPGGAIRLLGAEFDEDTKVEIEGTEVPAVRLSSKEVMIPTPEFSDEGLKNGVLRRRNQSIEFQFYHTNSKTPIATDYVSAAEVCLGETRLLADGQLVKGTAPCAAKAVQVLCTSDGAKNCVATDEFPAAAAALLLPVNIKNGVTLGGVRGSYPSAATPLAGADATADLEATGLPGKLAAATAFEWFSPDGTRHTAVGNVNLSAANLKSGVSLFGVSGTYGGEGVAACTANGTQNCMAAGAYFAAAACTANDANCYVPAYTASSQPLKAISYDVIEAGKSSIRTSLTLGGITGTLGNCAEGDSGCVAVGPTYKAAAVDGATGNKILSGQSLAGVAGNVTLPALGKVLSGISFGAGGTAVTGTLTLPLASQVLTGSGTYGDPGSALTPSYSPDFPDLANVRAGDTVNGASGTLSDCNAAGASGCVATTTYKTMNLSAAGTATGLTGTNFNTTIAAAGNFEFWDANGTRYSVAGDADLAAANIAIGTDILGVAGSATLEAHANCTAANQSGCVATSTYKTMDLSTVTAGAGLTSTNFNSKLAASGSFEFWDASGVRHSVTGDTDLTATNILSTGNIFGVAGSATAAPANCSSNGSQSCVATGSYFAATACAADASNCFVPTYAQTSQPLKAISYDAINAGQASMRTSLTLSGIAGTLATCSGANGTGCVTTATYPSMDISLATSGMTDLTASNFNASLAAAASFEFWDSTGARHQMAGDSDLAAANIANAVVVHGVSGTATLESHANCTAANQTGCVAVNPFRTMNLTSVGASSATGLTAANFATRIATGANSEFWDAAGARHLVAGDADLSEGNVKAEVIIHGVTGQYPSASYTLPSASTTADLDTATFDAKVKSSAAFEYWNSDGVRQTGAGDADIIATNIVSTATIFGLTGGVSLGVAPDPWDVRVGTVINGVTGQLKTSCRNRANSSLWDTAVPLSATVNTGSPGSFTITGHGFAVNDVVRVGATTSPTGFNINTQNYYVRAQTTNTFQLSATSGGTSLNFSNAGANVTVYKWADGTINWWDTIDDYNYNDVYPTTLVSGWTSATDCDYSNWQDVTADGTCDAAADDCIMKDRISGLMWSESSPVAGVAASLTSLNWQKAIQHCNNLSFGGYTGWRLATQKELMDAYIHGIHDVGYNGAGTSPLSTRNNNLFISDTDWKFWSASAVSNSTTYAWGVLLTTGFMDLNPKSSGFQVLCVR